MEHKIQAENSHYKNQGETNLKKINNLNDNYPELAKEWHPTKNGDLKPEDVTIGSHQKVWWLGKCGHEWDAIIKDRVRGYGCPICAGKRVIEGVNDLATIQPTLTEEWDYKKNNPLLPSNVAGKSHKIVWWVCKNGHSWQTSVDNRVRGRGCPYCNSKIVIEGVNDLASQNPFLLSEYSKKNETKASELFLNSHRKVWWNCSICGHEWQASVDSRQRGNGCPACAQRTQTSFPEQAIYYYILKSNPDAVNRCTTAFGEKTELDIYIPSAKFGIEYDGHYWHKGEISDHREKAKFQLCKENGIRLVRITDKELLKHNYCDYLITTTDGLDKAIKELGQFVSIPEDIDTNRDRIAIMETYISKMKTESFASIYPEIAEEWNYERNGSLTPDMFSKASMQIKVWWKCKKGHEWQSTIAHRTQMKSKCPYCSNRKILKGYNDFLTTNQSTQLLDEWDYAKNNAEGIFPDSITEGSKKKVWWKCKLGHEWQTTITERKRGYLCPFCSGRYPVVGETDLCTTHPTLAREWNYKKNAPLTPQMVSHGSSKKVWWKCKKGHEWQSVIRSRVNGNGCPYCSGRYAITGETDLCTTQPQLIKEWDFEKNTEIKPTELTKGSGRKVWWKCQKCGHEWVSTIKDRSNGHGCPECARKKNDNKTMEN